MLDKGSKLVEAVIDYVDVKIEYELAERGGRLTDELKSAMSQAIERLSMIGEEIDNLEYTLFEHINSGR